MKLPTSRHIDRRLVVGSAAFGIGWGIAGFCLGPALVAIGLGQHKAWVFAGTMLVGMGLLEFIERRRRPARPPQLV